MQKKKVSNTLFYQKNAFFCSRWEIMCLRLQNSVSKSRYPDVVCVSVPSDAVFSKVFFRWPVSLGMVALVPSFLHPPKHHHLYHHHHHHYHHHQKIYSNLYYNFFFVSMLLSVEIFSVTRRGDFFLQGSLFIKFIFTNHAAARRREIRRRREMRSLHCTCLLVTNIFLLNSNICETSTKDWKQTTYNIHWTLFLVISGFLDFWWWTLFSMNLIMIAWLWTLDVGHLTLNTRH